MARYTLDLISDYMNIASKKVFDQPEKEIRTMLKPFNDLEPY